MRRPRLPLSPLRPAGLPALFLASVMIHHASGRRSGLTAPFCRQSADPGGVQHSPSGAPVLRTATGRLSRWEARSLAQAAGACFHAAGRQTRQHYVFVSWGRCATARNQSSRSCYPACPGFRPGGLRRAGAEATPVTQLLQARPSRRRACRAPGCARGGRSGSRSRMPLPPVRPRVSRLKPRSRNISTSRNELPAPVSMPLLPSLRQGRHPARIFSRYNFIVVLYTLVLMIFAH